MGGFVTLGDENSLSEAFSCSCFCSKTRGVHSPTPLKKIRKGKGGGDVSHPLHEI